MEALVKHGFSLILKTTKVHLDYTIKPTILRLRNLEVRGSIPLCSTEEKEVNR